MDEPPPKKRRKYYKAYHDADNNDTLDVPRQTVWRTENPQNVSGEKTLQHLNISIEAENQEMCENLNDSSIAKNCFPNEGAQDPMSSPNKSHEDNNVPPDRQLLVLSCHHRPSSEQRLDQDGLGRNSFVESSPQNESTEDDACSSSVRSRQCHSRPMALRPDTDQRHQRDQGDSDPESSSDSSPDSESTENDDCSSSGRSHPNHSRPMGQRPDTDRRHQRDQGDSDPESSSDSSPDSESTENDDCSSSGRSHPNHSRPMGQRPDTDRRHQRDQGGSDPDSSPDSSPDNESTEDDDCTSSGRSQPSHSSPIAQSPDTDQRDQDPNSSLDRESDVLLHGDADQGNNVMCGGMDSDSDEDSVGDYRDLDDAIHGNEIDLNEFSADETSANEDNDNQPQEAPPPPPPFGHNNLIEKLNGEYSGIIQDRVTVSRGEVILNVQEFCNQHPLPLTAQEDLYKLINSMFHKEIVPSTKYKLDKLFSGTTKIRYYFFCTNCFESFGELDYININVKICDICNVENRIKNLIDASFFIIVEFVDQLQLLLQDRDVACALKNPNEFPDNGNVMKDLHDGTEYRKFVASLDFKNGENYVSLSGSTDGTPLFKSSNLSIWPIFVSVNELPPHMRMSNILLAGLWFGKSHPQMDLFLEPFANYVRTLSLEGFSLNVSGEAKHYKAFLLSMCVDSGARGSVQCVHSHSGESSCNWCLHPGQAEGDGSSARKFLQFEVKPDLRNQEQMVRDGNAVLQLPGKDNHINGVTGLSPLLRCPKFDIVNGMVLDTLHWANFGVARRIGKLWLGETKKKKKKTPLEAQAQLPQYYVGSDETKSVLNARIAHLRPPREVRKLPREFSQVHDYSSREWENFALYFSIPIFINILPQRYLKHWILFVQALYLLMKSEALKKEIDVAGQLMEMFVDGVLELYGLKELNFNMHISTHASDNALRWGNAWSITTYAYENGNKVLKSTIHAEHGVPHQIIRSLDRNSSLTVLRSKASTAQCDEYRKSIARKEVIKSFFADTVECMMPTKFSPSREELWHCQQKNIDSSIFLQCKRIIVNKVCYSADKGNSRTDNSFACCADGSLVKIRKIIAHEMSGKVFLFVSKVRCNPYPLPALPREITTVGFSPFLYTVNLIEEGITVISPERLRTICVHSDVSDRFYRGTFLSVMANTNNVF